MPRKSAKKATKKKTVKKTVKKSAKTTAKKAVKRTAKRKKKDLVQAPGDQCFWVTDGTVLANLVELSEALDAMTEDVFRHHVNKEKNDFADWIEHVLEDLELAGKVRKSKKSTTARKVIVSRLRIYSV